jgi:phosphomannomutase
MFQAAVPYEAGLWKHFHALRPLRIAFGSPSGVVRDRFTRIFHKLACRLLPVDISVRDRVGRNRDDSLFERIAGAVLVQQAHFGVFVDDDGQRTVFFDESGQKVSPTQIGGLLANLMLAEFPGRALVAATSIPPAALTFAQTAARGLPFIDCESSFESCATAMKRHDAVFGTNHDGYYWFAEGFPTCDAIVSVARVLQVLSQSDAPLSEVALHRGSLSSPVA